MTGITPINPDYDPARQGRDAWLVGTLGAACLAIVVAAAAVGLGVRAVDESRSPGGSVSAGGAAPARTTVHLTEFTIDDATVAVGGSLEVMNQGSVAHNVTIRDTDAHTEDLSGGGTASLALRGIAAGDYTMFCAIPGHEAAGMKAALHVASAESGAGSGAAAHEMTADEMDASMNASIKAFPAKTDGLGAQMLEPKVLADGTKQFNLVATIVRWEVSPGRKVDAWTYNGTVPGPTIKVDPGDRVAVVITNKLPESTAIHFHGILTPNAMDGVPGITQEPIKKGATFTYTWTAQLTPAVGMYHSHQNAVKQVPNGMAGAFLVGDLPLPDGVKLAQQSTMMLDDAGTIGLALNGKSFPATTPIVAKLGDWIEVHYLNEGLMAHPMHLHGMPQLVIGKDGFAVDPHYEDTINVSPGERYSVLIHADQPGIWAWHCHILTHAEDATGMFGMVTALIVK